MKILVTGVLVFVCWASLSTWFYVCKIKGLCGEHELIMISTIKVNDAYTADSLPNTLAAKPAMPDNLLVYFAYDKSEFITGSDVLKFYDASISYMFHNPDAGLQIIGHTDSKGSDEYNQALGFRRARSVQDYFECKGIPVGKLKIESKGEKEPAENNTSDEGRAKNRRVSVTIKN
jgi:outer membrane protein OmpA-like peptidoglycan-associated protein